MNMPTLTATEARKRLYSLVDEVKESHEPIQIVGKKGAPQSLFLSKDWRNPGDFIPNINTWHA